MGILRKPMTALGANIRRARKALGWSQGRLATEAGLGRATIQRIETDESWSPDLATIDVIGEALGLGRGELLHESVSGPVAGMLSDYLASGFAAALEPPLSKGEREWLQGLGGWMWLGLTPTLESIHKMVLARRAALVPRSDADHI